MTGQDQDLQAFRRLAETWGGDLDRWPEDQRGWAAAMALDPPAAAILEEARRLDARIEAHPAASDARAAAVAGAVLGRIAQERIEGDLFVAPRAWWTPIAEALFKPSGAPSFVAYAGVALCVAVGALMGAAAPIGAPVEMEVASLLFAGQETSPFETSPFEGMIQ